MYIAYPGLLDSYNSDTAPDLAGAKYFVVKMYSVAFVLTSVNDLRTKIFHRINGTAKHLPTHDAIVLHSKRCKHQVMIWSNSIVPKPALLSPKESGWELSDDGSLSPMLMT